MSDTSRTPITQNFYIEYKLKYFNICYLPKSKDFIFTKVKRFHILRAKEAKKFSWANKCILVGFRESLYTLFRVYLHRAKNSSTLTTLGDFAKLKKRNPQLYETILFVSAQMGFYFLDCTPSKFIFFIPFHVTFGSVRHARRDPRYGRF